MKIGVMYLGNATFVGKLGNKDGYLTDALQVFPVPMSTARGPALGVIGIKVGNIELKGTVVEPPEDSDYFMHYAEMMLKPARPIVHVPADVVPVESKKRLTIVPEEAKNEPSDNPAKD